MLEDCRKGKLDKIVTMSVSRFARNLSDGLTILRELSAMGVTVHFVMESIDTESFLAQAVRE
jgi:DNA invertase Pin-like site-specific DNA recombinase